MPDDVEVDLGPRVLGVVEVEHPDAVDDPDRHGRDVADEVAVHAVGDERGREGDVAAGDRRRARAAVGDDDVAVHGDRPLAEPGQVHDAAQRAPDQPLDLVRPAADLALRGLALGALGGRARQHLVGAGDPARALAAEVRRDAVLDRRGAQHLGVAEADHARPLGPLLDPERDLDRPQVRGGAAVRAYVADRRPVPDAHALASPRSAALAASQSASSSSNDRSRSATSARRGRLLHVPEPAAELLVGGAQRALDLDAGLAADVDQHEQQVAQLLGPVGGVLGLDELADLLAHLVQHAVDRRPVVAEVGGALLHLLARGQRGQRAADPVERALRRRGPVGPVAAGGRGLGALAGLDPLPLAVHVGRGARLGVAEHVRVAAHDLRRERGPDVGHVEHALLGGELRVEDHLEQQVAELAGELRGRAALERVVDLVRLLEEVVPQRVVRLLPVPRAAVGLPEAGGDPGHPPRRREVGDGRDRARGTAVSLELVRGERRRPSSRPGCRCCPTGWSAG